MFVSAATVPAIPSLTSSSVKIDSNACSSCTPSRMPLTTSFAPPATCTQFWTPADLKPATVSGNLRYSRIGFYRYDTNVECQPSQFYAQCTGCGDKGPGLHVSPGICPSSSVAASTGIENGVTTHYCCPFEAPTYTTRGSEGGMCYGNFSSSSISLVYHTTTREVSMIMNPDKYDASWTYITSDVDTRIFVEFGEFTAYPFYAAFKPEELPQTSVSSNTGGEVVHLPTRTPSSDPPPFSRISERAAAEIGIGAALGMLSLSGFGYLLCRRRLRRQKRQQQGTIEESSDEYRAEPSGEYRTELHNEHKVEMHDETVAAKELDTPHKLDYVVMDSVEPVELDALETVDTPEELDAPDHREEDQLEHAGDILEELPCSV